MSALAPEIVRPDDGQEAVRELAAGKIVEIPAAMRLETLMWMQQEGHPRPESVIVCDPWCQLFGVPR